MDTTMGRGGSRIGHYGPSAIGEFPSYDPREDHSANANQSIIADKHGSEECDKRETSKQGQTYGGYQTNKEEHMKTREKTEHRRIGVLALARASTIYVLTVW